MMNSAQTDRFPNPETSEVLREGQPVVKTEMVSTKAIEAWIGEIASLSGQKLDFYFHDFNRATIYALGDMRKVNDALDECPLKDPCA